MKARRRASFPGLALALGLVTACGSTRGLYVWDGYEESVARIAEGTGQMEVDAEIERMVALVERSGAAERRTPPGVHAHLGYLYSIKGDVSNAVAALTAEKVAYPESAVFIDGLIERLKRLED